MRTAVSIAAGILILALWIASSLHAQSSVGTIDTTVQAQMTAVVGPTPTPTVHAP